MKPVIIWGSARSNGYTSMLVQSIQSKLLCPSINLGKYSILPFDYQHQNANDDFLPLTKQLIANYDTFIFATPVYWYSMSSTLKTFFDRLTDLLTIEKELGRKLRGKNMAVATTSMGNHLGENFWLPFSETANYLGMNYLANLHTIEEQGNEQIIQDFLQKIKT